MDPDLRVVVLGNVGAGKSASGNTILGRTDAFVSKRSFTSVTKQISHVTANVFDKRIQVFDTPGILGSETLIKTLCEEILRSSTPCLFLLVIKIDRFTIEQKNAAEAVLRVLGEEGIKKSFLLFSCGDTLGEMTLEEFINEDPESDLLKIVGRFSDRRHKFNNKNGGVEQVKELLQKSGHLSYDRPDPQSLQTRRFVLLGIPGDGKSASGNTILGSERFDSGSSFNVKTTESSSQSGRVEGRDVTVVDTPGFTGKLSARKMFDEIEKAIEQVEPGAHAFIIVVQASRVSEAHIVLFQMLSKIFGKDISKYLIVLFTHADKLKRGERLEDLIRESKHISDLISKCSNRYCQFDNTARHNRVQVRTLLDKIDKVIQSNRGEVYTRKRFYEVQVWHVKCSVQFERFIQWLRKYLNILDNHSEYSRFSQGCV